jgi:hypothetical protein
LVGFDISANILAIDLLAADFVLANFAADLAIAHFAIVFLLLNRAVFVSSLPISWRPISLPELVLSSKRSQSIQGTGFVAHLLAGDFLASDLPISYRPCIGR